MKCLAQGHTFILMSANAFNLYWSEMLSVGKELTTKVLKPNIS